VDAFFGAGCTRAPVLEVVTIAATKTISNYANRTVRTEKEGVMADPAFGWTSPRDRRPAA
jgi:hypothetical protein